MKELNMDGYSVRTEHYTHYTKHMVVKDDMLGFKVIIVQPCTNALLLHCDIDGSIEQRVELDRLKSRLNAIGFYVCDCIIQEPISKKSVA